MQSNQHIGGSGGSGMPRTIHYKLVLLGDASVGKSCIVVRFAKDEFFEYQEPTIGAAFMTQSVDLGEDVVKFEIWDTAGQERYRSLAPMYYRGAAAAAVVYDITNKESYDGAKRWVNELKSVLPPDAVIALTGNKCDLEGARVIPTQLASQFARDQRLLFREVSAKDGTGVRTLFEEIATKLPKKSRDSDTGGFQVGGGEQTASSSGCAC